MSSYVGALASYSLSDTNFVMRKRVLCITKKTKSDDLCYASKGFEKQALTDLNYCSSRKRQFCRRLEKCGLQKTA
jgi:hypothetical protein